ncbi:uncharacterized protein LOC126997820 [Eriocheir sinensis]|uniref:uncharacterized protein LOC126997820 n=1 Tax=Eriocheir sinensis TaxID=95602 RepID=UPI0021C949C5|nr:uncharacterized protein LOC126997820 [Eriocheir sinensis]
MSISHLSTGLQTRGIDVCPEKGEKIRSTSYAGDLATSTRGKGKSRDTKRGDERRRATVTFTVAAVVLGGRLAFLRGVCKKTPVFEHRPGHMAAALWVAAVAVAAAVGGGGVCVQAQSDMPPMSHSHRVVLDQDGAFVMLWSPRDKAIVIEVQVAAKGYVGLGFSPNGGMKGADIVLGWVTAAGDMFLQDRYAEGNMAPRVDESQDVTVLGGYQNDTHTVLRFSRLWDTCDENDFVLSEDTVRVIWAYSNTDPASQNDVMYHAARGSKSLYLKSPQFVMPQMGPDVKTWDFLSPNVSLPGDLDTLYWCKIFKIPPMPVKSQMIGYVPVIQKGNNEHVHHVLFYECSLPDSDTHFEKWASWEGTQCYSANMPLSWKHCRSPIIVWAIGGDGEMFPDHAGFPIGEEHGGATYFMMEMHYDNPNLRQGVVDSSGVRIYYTENLREYDAGNLIIGHKVGPVHVIPPGQPTFVSTGFCDTTCTQQGLPKGGVRLFQGLLHAHLLGVSLVLRQIRDGQELPTVMKDMSYDFNYQSARVLKQEVTVLPGDTLIMECYYDSSAKRKPTFGGLGTKEEMCLAFMSYYPRVNVSICGSQPQLKDMVGALGVEDNYDGQLNNLFAAEEIDVEKETQMANEVASGTFTQDLKPIEMSHMFKTMKVTATKKFANMTVFDVLHDEATWKDPAVMDAFQKMVTSGVHQSACSMRGGVELKATGDRHMAAALWVAAVAVAAAVGGGGVCVQAQSDLPPMSHSHRVVLDQDGAFVMLWSPRDNAIVIEVQVAAKGYVGLGFSPNGGMKGADIVLGWVTAAGDMFLQDRYAEGNMAPRVDESQDVTVLGGYQNDTHTVLRFSRLWDTCDENDFVLSEDTVRVIWAYSNTDPASQNDVMYHAARGTKSLYLRSPQFVMPQMGPDVKTWDFLSPNVSLPGDLDTLYWCKIFKIPPMPVKSHMIGYVPVIQEGNNEHVHHLLLYQCSLPDSDTHFEKWTSWEGTQCYSANMPLSWKQCKSPIVVWAIGGDGEMFPDHAGFPIGEEHGVATYFMMEMHYDNPNLRQGVVDSSGVRIYYTENLREYDAGNLIIGHRVSPFLIIPPGQPTFMSAGFCDSTCTQQAFPKGGVRLFQGLLHTHLLGVSLVLRQIRDGQELPTVMKDMNYDFNYQSARVLKQEVTVLPGDTLIMECYYDSSAKRKPTFGGLGTKEEMCLAFMSYYPRVNVSICGTRPQLKDVVGALGVEDNYDGQLNKLFTVEEIDVEKETQMANEVASGTSTQDLKPLEMSHMFKTMKVTATKKFTNMTVFDVLHDEANWKDPAVMDAFQKMVTSGVHRHFCLKRGGGELKNASEKVPFPSFNALTPTPGQCMKG